MWNARFFTSVGLGGLLCMAGPAIAQEPQPAADKSSQASATSGEETLKVGKKDDVEFREETLVGEMRLKPGHYQVQHRVEGSDHFVHFTEVGKSSHYDRGVDQGHPGNLKCRLEPLPDKVKETTVHYVRGESGSWKITKVLIRGENAAHVF